MEKTSDLRLVIVTTDTYDNAQNIARNIVSEKLAACCTIIQNCISVFGWQNTIQESHEYTLMIKTQLNKLIDLETRILELHSYEVPEIIALPIDYTHASYLNWLRQSLSETP